MELILVEGGGDRRRYALGNGETLIGRRPDCRIVLDAPSISPRHARIFSVDGHAVLYGLDEAWPVYVNGEAVARHVLSAGDSIELGHYRLRYTDAVSDDPLSELDQEDSPGLDDDAGAMPDKGFIAEPADSPTSKLEDEFFPQPDGDPTAELDDDSFPQPDDDPTAELHDDFFPRLGDHPAAALEHDSFPVPLVESIAPAGESDALLPVGALPREPGWTQQEDDQAPEPWTIHFPPADPGGARPTGRAPAAAPPDTRDDQQGTPPETDALADPSPWTDEELPGPASVLEPNADEAESEETGAYHLDILTGINRGRRVTLTNDLVVLGFNQQRLVELRNDDGALSLRRLDDDAAAELNGVPMTAEPREALPGRHLPATH
jgi:hypothetical protein